MHRLPSAALLTILITSTARAHDLSATARLEGGRVFIEAYFDDNTAPRDARIAVTDGTEQVVAEGRTDDDGKWSFAAPPPGDYRLTVDAGGGHKKTISLTIPGQGEGVVSHGSPREEFTRTRWLGLGIGILLIAGFVIAVRLWGKRARGAEPPQG
jgi:Carboxypeptidase regulatory-like domain